MEAGSTFLRADKDSHLWVIISDPTKDPERVLVVNLTTHDQRKEDVCILERGDHPWITHKTCVNYEDAIVTSVAKLFELKDGGLIRLREPVAALVLKRMRDGAAESTRMALDNANILIEQGLIDC